MVDISQVKYSVSVIGDDGTQYNIKNYIQGLGWEESSKEISMRLTFKARNDDTSKGQLSSLVKPGKPHCSNRQRWRFFQWGGGSRVC